MTTDDDGSKKTRPAEAGLKIQFVNATRNQAVLL